MSRPLQTRWTYEGGGSTVLHLLHAIGKADLVRVGDSELRTDLLAYSSDLRGYDIERAESAIRQARARRT